MRLRARRLDGTESPPNVDNITGIPTPPTYSAYWWPLSSVPGRYSPRPRLKIHRINRDTQFALALRWPRKISSTSFSTVAA